MLLRIIVMLLVSSSCFAQLGFKNGQWSAEQYKTDWRAKEYGRIGKEYQQLQSYSRTSNSSGSGSNDYNNRQSPNNEVEKPSKAIAAINNLINNFNRGEYASCLNALKSLDYKSGSISNETISGKQQEQLASLEIACMYYTGKPVMQELQSNLALKKIVESITELRYENAPYFILLNFSERGKTKEAAQYLDKFDNIQKIISKGATGFEDLYSIEAKLVAITAADIYYFDQDFNTALPLYNAVHYSLKRYGGTQKLDSMVKNLYLLHYGHTLVETANPQEGKNVLAGVNWKGIDKAIEFDINTKMQLYTADYKAASSLCTAYLAKNPGDYFARLRLSEVQLLSGKYAEGLKNLEALYLEKPSAGLLIKKGLIIAIGGLEDSSGTITKLSTSLLNNKDENYGKSVRAVVALYWLQKKAPPVALSFWQPVIQAGAKTPLTEPFEYYSLAKTLIANGKPDFAINFLGLIAPMNYLDSKNLLSGLTEKSGSDAGYSTRLTNILEAMTLNDTLAFKKFIALGQANTNLGDGYTPLHEAYLRGNLFFVEHLLKNGANVNALYKNEYPVFYFYSYTHYLKNEGVCPARFFEPLKAAGCKLSANTIDKYILMNRDRLVSPVTKKYYSGSDQKCEKTVMQILETLKK